MLFRRNKRKKPAHQTSLEPQVSEQDSGGDVGSSLSDEVGSPSRVFGEAVDDVPADFELVEEDAEASAEEELVEAVAEPSIFEDEEDLGEPQQSEPVSSGGAVARRTETGSMLALAEPRYSALPTFSMSANSRLWRREVRDLSYIGEVTKLFRDVLTPTQPKRSTEDFCGRAEEIAEIIQAIEEERAHTLISSEAGMGKTSLANVICQLAEEAGYIVVRLTCSPGLTSAGIIRAILEQMSDQIEATPAGPVLLQQLGLERLGDLVDPEADLESLLSAFARLKEAQALILLDDFDRLADTSLVPFVVQLIKGLTDRGAPMTFLVCGAAERPEALLGDSEPLPPSLYMCHLRALSDQDVLAVLAHAEQRIGIRFDEDARRAMRVLSRGHAAVLQWLAFLATRSAVRRFSIMVERDDVVEVCPEVANRLRPGLASRYEEICARRQSEWLESVLFLAALAPTDSSGEFTSNELSAIAPSLLDQEVPTLSLHGALSRFTGDEGGQAILRKRQSRQGTVYSFIDPAMRVIVLLHNVSRLPLDEVMRLQGLDDAGSWTPHLLEGSATSA
jgi:hypothetical protein